MKKFITFLLLSLVLAGAVYPQVKVKLKLMNPGVDSTGRFYFNLVAVIQPGQTWRVGSSNIRVAFRTIPPNGLIPFAENPVQYPLACINGGNYFTLNTTLINIGTRISFNITHLTGQCCTLTTGTYVLGRIRFSIIDSTCCTIDTISTSGTGGSVVHDSITALTYGAQWIDSNFTTCIPVAAEQQGINVPTVYKLYQNYPNPFNPATSIKFDIPKVAEVKLIIYDVLGREVAVLVDQQLKLGTPACRSLGAGRYEVDFDGTNYPSGVYLYKLEASDYAEVKKMVLIK